MDILIFMIIFIPLIAGILLFIPFIPDTEKIIRIISKFFGIFILSLTVLLSLFFDFMQSDFSVEASNQWINILGINASFCVDTMSVFMMVMTAFVFLIVIHLSKNVIKTAHRLYYSLIFILETSVMAVLCSKDLFVFFVFMVSSVLPVYLLLTKWGKSSKAATGYTICKLFSYALIFTGLILVYYVNFKNNGTISSDISDIDVSDIPDAVRNLIFMILLSGFFINLYVFPFHKHHIAAVTSAPVPVSIILSSVLTNAFSVSVLRYFLIFFQEEYTNYANIIIFFAILNIVYALLCIKGEKNLKRILAYTNIINIGIFISAISSSTAAGITGGIYQLLSYSFIITGLFIIQDHIFRQYGTNNIKRIYGVREVMPRASVLLILFMFSAAFAPLLSGFPALFSAACGLFLFCDIKILPVVFLFVSVLSGVVIITVFQDVLKGSVKDIKRKLQDIRTKQFSILIMIFLCILFMGVFPFIITDIISEYANTAFNLIGAY